MATEQRELEASPGYALMRMDGGKLQQIIADNLGPSGLTQADLDRVKIPAGGGRSWTVPSLEGDRDERELTGIIIHWADRRAYWPEAFSGENTAPACSSEDTITGIGNPGGACERCRFAQWESDPKGGKGQACKQLRQVFITREDGAIMPLLVTLPPTSLAPLRRYFLRLASSELPYWAVVSKLTLEKTKNTNGIEYSRVDASMVRRLSPDELRGVEQYRNAIRPALDRVAIEAGDYQMVDPSSGEVIGGTAGQTEPVCSIDGCTDPIASFGADGKPLCEAHSSAPSEQASGEPVPLPAGVDGLATFISAEMTHLHYSDQEARRRLAALGRVSWSEQSEGEMERRWRAVQARV